METSVLFGQLCFPKKLESHVEACFDNLRQGQRVNILSFASHAIYCNNLTLPLWLYSQKQVSGHIWLPGHSLLTPDLWQSKFEARIWKIIYIYLNCFAIHPKLTHCKSTVLRYKNQKTKSKLEPRSKRSTCS